MDRINQKNKKPEAKPRFTGTDVCTTDAMPIQAYGNRQMKQVGKVGTGRFPNSPPLSLPLCDSLI